MSHLQSTTKKLFYGKWPYKISTRCRGGYFIRYNKLTQLRAIALRENIDNSLLLDFINRYNKIKHLNHKTRSESNIINIFVETKQDFDLVVKTMGKFVNETTAPENNTILEKLNQKEKIIIVNELPYKLYTHKITLGTMPLSDRYNLINLLEKYPNDKIKLSKCTKRYLLGENQWMQNPFILIADSKLLTFIALAASKYIKKTEMFVLKSSINTCLAQEETCQLSAKA